MKFFKKKPGSNDSGPKKAASGPVAVGFRISPADQTVDAGDFPKFRASAGDQLDSRRLDRITSLRLKLRGAFTPAQPVADRKLFAGRKQVLATLIRSIEEQRLHLVVYGDRGIGKTSILHILSQAAREARYFVVYVSSGAEATFDEVFRAIAVQLPLNYHVNYGPTSPEAEHGGTMADILPPGPVSVRAASELCTKLISTRALIFIDEFDRSESPEFRRNIAEFLKNLSDRQCRVQLVLAGVAANLTEILTEIPSIRRNIFALDVPKMTSDEIRQLIRTGETASGLKYEDKAVETIVAVANGLPYLASLLGQYVGLSALNEGRTNVTYADVQVAIEDVLSELNAQMSVASRTHLRALKRANGHLVLGRLAGHATMSHGAFDLEAVDAIFPEKDNAALCRRILADMATDRSLIETFEDDTGQHYRFVDANVPQYLWLLAEQGRLAGEGTKAAPQTQSA